MQHVEAHVWLRPCAGIYMSVTLLPCWQDLLFNIFYCSEGEKKHSTQPAGSCLPPLDVNMNILHWCLGGHGGDTLNQLTFYPSPESALWLCLCHTSCVLRGVFKFL